MTIHASRNSVAGQVEGRPLNMIRSIASTPMPVVAKQLQSYLKGVSNNTRPEEQAMRFYMLEHASGIIRAKYGAHDVLPAGELAVMEQYNEQSLTMATRAYYYLLLICWREMRYIGSVTKEAVFRMAGQQAGADPETMLKFLRLCDESHAIECSKNWEKAGNITLGQLTKALVYGYRKGKWGSSYGGPKWAVVTECLDSFVWGKTSAAMMLDTVWTLAHNTAPIFNKSMLYSGQDKDTLLEILDVQRAGMVPQYILTATSRAYRGRPHIDHALINEVKHIGTVLGGVFADKSDVHWPTVKALGAKGSYSHYVEKLGQKDQVNAGDVLSLKHMLAAKAALKSAPMQTAPFSLPLVKKIAPGVTVIIGRKVDGGEITEAA